MKSKSHFLPHLENSIPENVFSYTLSLYSVALEGWRRGLTLRFENKKKSKSQTVFYLSNDVKEHRFEVTRGDEVTREAIKICINKELTKKYLVKANVPTPKGKVFHEESDSEVISYAKGLGYPLVVKPTDGTGGHGVIAGIRNEKELKEALMFVRKELKYDNIIIEKHFDGIDCRAYVIDNKVVGAIKRVPAYVIGDGQSSIRTLIKRKEEERFKNPALFGRKIAIDQELHNMLDKQGYSLNSIPPKNERVVLKSKNNVSSGGESIDITDELSAEIKQIAVDAANAIPGLVQGGIDLMVNLEERTATVIEINSRPHITAQIFPTKGKARNIPKAIIDYYFPETKADYNSPLAFFDFNHVWEAFRKGVSQEITIPDLPKGKLIARSFYISDIKSKKYRSWLRRNALRLNLSGYVKHFRSENRYQIIVLGTEKSVDRFRKLIKETSIKKYKSKKISESPYSQPIQMGFKIIEAYRDEEYSQGYTPLGIEGLRKELLRPKFRKKLKKSAGKRDNHRINTKSEDYYKKEYEKIIESTSWKVTRPLRYLGKLLKKKDK